MRECFSYIPVSNASRLNFLNKDAKLSTVLALKSNHTEAKTSSDWLLQLHMCHIASLQKRYIYTYEAPKLKTSLRSLFEVPPEI